MQYSGTFTAGLNTGQPVLAQSDPIADAREFLRKASHLPFAASHPFAWSARFAQLIADARGSVKQHIIRAARTDSPMMQIERDEPRLKDAIERQRQEHADLARQIEDLYAEVSVANDIDIWRMIDLGEKAILLEMALARHHNRLVRLVYETTNRELVGEAG
ncbi:MAG: hypothetical protein ABI305_04290 [Tepidiformaceae bacterium]